ncbi:2Fe-2S iron-sulfur cluster-binding protein [Vibrio coralliilyticus]|jgi:ferredoxin|uniref:2Fe-2S iron-sulfur cluster-binding protein n=1 Tax=Vibrio coralliilyticus TaxID=190893 RepID=UPI000BAAE05A|nr:2Fe-2S iron-sulfur cluster-binding protein [Vibrio coralliilyticus]NOI31119.1 2Fe-2S iron-sulfur cluster binding domain-containing protein [Vibrio coralliilyticus]NOI51243.1 2Fe-2S iron-sulfur cluster binding domain-containing protein [Vibrio coralliilyticus]NRF32332.1 2Fe-2S iron-sulfur cluster binding domain-containing protein [Vibrio coralliilyticus]NRF54361.1 2Fe-2S iron-sulfur cluster binding domain-containing protein [Vibrio coralliilyticus]NRG04875.1 2Fe-2S iron-sulfur cluster bindin
MSHLVTLQPQNIQFDVQVGETVLEAALNHNISFPNRCQVGACAACLCRKIEGRVTYQLEPMLTEKEQQQGWVFACQAFAESNLVLTFEE